MSFMFVENSNEIWPQGKGVIKLSLNSCKWPCYGRLSEVWFGVWPVGYMTSFSTCLGAQRVNLGER